MSPKDRATRLRAQGNGYREIAAELGVSFSTVYRWLNPAYAEQGRAVSLAWKNRNRAANRRRDREYKAAARATCPECGGLMGSGSAFREPSRCADCVSARRDARWARIEGWWAEGWSMAEIQRELGWTKGHLSSEIDRIRRAGRDLPYRYRNTKRQRAPA